MSVDFPGGTGKILPASGGDVRDVGSISGSGRSPGGGHGNHSSISVWRIPWTEEPTVHRATVHRVTKSWTQLK